MADKFMSTPYDKPADDCPAFMQVFVNDIPRAKQFFESVFGWIFQSPAYTPTVTVFKTGGQVMGGMHLRENHPGSGPNPAFVIFIKVADVQATLDKAVAAGGKVVKEFWTEGNHTEMGEFEDTEGNRWGVLRWLM